VCQAFWLVRIWYNVALEFLMFQMVSVSEACCAVLLQLQWVCGLWRFACARKVSTRQTLE
jgi:hypothetical protein